MLRLWMQTLFSVNFLCPALWTDWGGGGTKKSEFIENKFQLDDNVQYYRNGTFPLQVMI